MNLLLVWSTLPCPFFLDLVIVSRRAGALKGTLITWSNQCLHTENVTFSLFCKLNKKSSFRLHMIKKGLTDVKSPRKESSTLVLVEYIWITCNRYAHSKLRIFFPIVSHAVNWRPTGSCQNKHLKFIKEVSKCAISYWQAKIIWTKLPLLQ